MKFRIIILTFQFVIFSSIVLFSQDNIKKAEKNYTSSTLFSSKDPLSLDLYINKKALFKDVGDDRKYHPAIIKYKTVHNDIKEQSIKIQTRGFFRRNPENCSMPPLKCKFSKNEKDTNLLFDGQSKLKLVVPCRQSGEKFQEYVVLEYLCYQTFELLSPMSYKTRLAKISLVDSIKTKDTLKFTGFFIEETDQMAQRNKGIVKKLKKYHPEQVNREQMTMVNVFQYLIGNTDWSVEVGHNIKLLFIDNHGIPFAIPFDFDWAGIVDASYAVPAPQIGTTSVKTRVFRGYLRKLEEYEPVIKLFNDKKEAIYAIYRNCDLISTKTKVNTIKYIDEFYEIINNPGLLKREFIDNCRKL